jgi:hypothetical protein
VGGERVRAFVPCPLPPEPPVVFQGDLQRTLESAVLSRLREGFPLSNRLIREIHGVLLSR